MCVHPGDCHKVVPDCSVACISVFSPTEVPYLAFTNCGLCYPGAVAFLCRPCQSTHLTQALLSFLCILLSVGPVDWVPTHSLPRWNGLECPMSHVIPQFPSSTDSWRRCALRHGSFSLFFIWRAKEPQALLGCPGKETQDRNPVLLL
jgi:hypothetical protein